MAENMIKMDDGALQRTWTSGSKAPQRLPVVMLHGGPGVADYLQPVAAMIEDLGVVHRNATSPTIGRTAGETG